LNPLIDESAGEDETSGLSLHNEEVFMKELRLLPTRTIYECCGELWGKLRNALPEY
jgi:hypothetical protein